jgi:hypothetical protein
VSCASHNTPRICIPIAAIIAHLAIDYRRFKTERASRKAAGESDSQRNAPRKKTKHYHHVRTK